MGTAAFGGLDRLTIADGSAWRRLAPALLPHPFAPRRREAFPDPAAPPSAKVGLDRGPGSDWPWEHPPWATTAEEGEDAIADPPQVHRTRTSTRFGRRQQRLQNSPFALAQFGAQFGRVGAGGTFTHCSPPCARTLTDPAYPTALPAT
jgi:hypothetical protein